MLPQCPCKQDSNTVHIVNQSAVKWVPKTGPASYLGDEGPITSGCSNGVNSEGERAGEEEGEEVWP